MGQILADLVRVTAGMLLTFGIGTALGFRVETGPLQTLGAFAVLIGFAFAFSWIQIFVGVLAKTPVVVQTMSLIIVFPLTFASSVFVPTKTFPSWLQAWSTISPMSTVVNTVRGLLVGGDIAGSGAKALIWAVALFCIFAPLSVWAYRRRV